MLRWWTRVGIWLLAAILASYAADTLSTAGVFGGFFLGRNALWAWGYLGVVLKVVTMLWVATVCSRLLTDVYDQHAAPEPPGFLRARFIVCYLNALVPVVLTLAAELIQSGVYRWHVSRMAVSISYTRPPASFISVADATARQLDPLLMGLISVAWLVCLLVLVPRRPILAWILPLAGIIGGIPVYFLYAFAPPQSPLTHYFYPVSGWGWLLGGVLLLFMFYALRMRLGPLMYTAYGILVAAPFASALLFYSIYCGAGGLVPALLRLSFNIPRFTFDSPFVWHTFIEWAELTYPSSETVLGSFAILVPLIVEPLWALGMLALIYYVILAPWWGRKQQQAQA